MERNKRHAFGSFPQPSLRPLSNCVFVVQTPETYLGKALLAVILEVFRVDVDVVSVDAVRLRELGGVLDELLHLHSRLVFAQLLKGLHRYIGGRHTV